MIPANVDQRSLLSQSGNGLLMARLTKDAPLKNPIAEEVSLDHQGPTQSQPSCQLDRSLGLMEMLVIAGEVDSLLPQKSPQLGH